MIAEVFIVVLQSVKTTNSIVAMDAASPWTTFATTSTTASTNLYATNPTAPIHHVSFA